MKRRFLALLSALTLAFTFTACTSEKPAQESDNKGTEVSKQAESVELAVSAAASLKDALEEINAKYEEETGNKVVLNLAGSGKLVQQILEGAPADVFISASNAKMKDLVEKEKVEESAVSILLKNDLVMISPKDAENKPSSIQDLENIDGKIAIGEVETVPAGTYAKDSLTNLGLWDKIQDKIVYAKDVRSVLSYVEQGEVVAGFVYSSDAVVSTNSEIIEVVDPSTHKDIVYPIAVLRDSEKVVEAKGYEDFLKKPESLEIFKKFGFKTEVE